MTTYNNINFDNSADLREAIKYLDENMKGTLGDYEIAAVTETPIMDVYPYKAEI